MIHPVLLHRRLFITTAAAGLSLSAPRLAFAEQTRSATARVALAALEAEIGGRVGVAALDTGAGTWLVHRADERFAMCSTFKALLAARVLGLIDQGRLSLDDRIAFSPSDLLPYAPRVRARLAEGAMNVNDLCAAAVEVSDNTAANLLLARTGGPAALTAWLGGLGDQVTRLDRTEPELNTNLPGDPRDTATPRSFAGTLRTLLFGKVLSDGARARLTGWLVDCESGRNRLRAAAPGGWRVGDKTGTGENGAVNDVAVIWPPGRPPLLIAALLDGSKRPVEDLAAAHVRIGRIVLDALA